MCLAAFDSLAKITERGNAVAIGVLVFYSVDAKPWIRSAAVEALAKIAERGNVVAIEAVARRLEDVAESGRLTGAACAKMAA